MIKKTNSQPTIRGDRLSAAAQPRWVAAMTGSVSGLAGVSTEHLSLPPHPLNQDSSLHVNR